MIPLRLRIHLQADLLFPRRSVKKVRKALKFLQNRA